MRVVPPPQPTVSWVEHCSALSPPFPTRPSAGWAEPLHRAHGVRGRMERGVLHRHLLPGHPLLHCGHPHRHRLFIHGEPSYPHTRPSDMV